ETRNVDVEVRLRQQNRELAQFGGKSGTIPAGVKGDPILSERKSALFQFRQMRDLNHGHELQSELTRDLVAKMTGENVPLLVDDEGIDEPEPLDSRHKLVPLFFRVSAGIPLRAAQLLHRPHFDGGMPKSSCEWAICKLSWNFIRAHFH